MSVWTMTVDIHVKADTGLEAYQVLMEATMRHPSVIAVTPLKTEELKNERH